MKVYVLATPGPVRDRGWLYGYAGPLAAAFFGPILEEAWPRVLLWEAEAGGPRPFAFCAACRVGAASVRVLRPVPLPEIPCAARAEAAIRVSLLNPCPRWFEEWAAGWLSGTTAAAFAREAAARADSMEAEAMAAAFAAGWACSRDASARAAAFAAERACSRAAEASARAAAFAAEGDGGSAEMWAATAVALSPSAEFDLESILEAAMANNRPPF